MSELSPIHLVPIPIALGSTEFAEISGWPFADPFVRRLLRDDIPQRVRFGHGRIWAYRNPSGQIAGFSTIDLCEDYRDLTQGLQHPYIPLLATNPTITSLGYGTSIVKHLIAEATLYVCIPELCSDLLLLDVYADNTKAINLYKKCGFTLVIDEPIPDPKEEGKPYFVMARRVSVASA